MVTFAWAIAALVLVAYLHWPGWTLLLAWLGLYLAQSVWYPFTTCPMRCGGRARDKSGKNWRPCFWCGGKGSRVRWGRRLYENVTGHRKHT